MPLRTRDGARISVIVASSGRRPYLEFLLGRLARQTLRPAEVIFSVAGTEDAPDPGEAAVRATGLAVARVIGPKGLCHQRNRGLERVAPESDIVFFCDDDYVPSRFALEGIAASFAAFPEVGGVSGVLLADGINSPGVRMEAAAAMVDGHDAAHAPSAPRIIRRARGLYGCNMAFRVAAIGSLRFDERLPLYGWQEDIDFSSQIEGDRIHSSAVVGVHCGTKQGREKRGKLLGYSQIANPVYLVRKGTMRPRLALRHCTRNLLANHTRAFWPEPWVDRRGRLAGNWAALLDLARGRLAPERILEFD